LSFFDFQLQKNGEGGTTELYDCITWRLGRCVWKQKFLLFLFISRFGLCLGIDAAKRIKEQWSVCKVVGKCNRSMPPALLPNNEAVLSSEYPDGRSVQIHDVHSRKQAFVMGAISCGVVISDVLICNKSESGLSTSLFGIKQCIHPDLACCCIVPRLHNHTTADLVHDVQAFGQWKVDRYIERISFWPYGSEHMYYRDDSLGCSGCLQGVRPHKHLLRDFSPMFLRRSSYKLMQPLTFGSNGGANGKLASHAADAQMPIRDSHITSPGTTHSTTDGHHHEWGQ
jgi:hypothetical protein